MNATTASPVQSPEDFAGRLLEATAAAFDVFSVYLGEQLGYYRALHEGGSATSAELAERAGTHERYAREWLEQQATTGILIADDPSAPAEERRFRLPEGYEAVLVDPLSELFAVPVGRFVIGAMKQAPKLLEVYRTGGGVSWEEYGADPRTAQADFNRPFFTSTLIPGYISKVPGVAEALARPGARVAEIGSGGGWAAIAVAKAYPEAHVDGFDLDGASVRLARANAEAESVADRVSFHHRDAGEAGIGGQYDLVLVLESIHDMSDPVSALRTMRRLTKPGGAVVVMDERVGDEFGNVGDFNERLYYGYSISICLPDGMSHQPSVGTGTVMRAPTLRNYAEAAGFAEARVLPLEHELFQFYQLV